MDRQSLKHRLTFQTHELEPEEEVERTWVALVTFSQEDNLRGRGAKTAGNLLLTNRRLLFEPLQLAKLGEDLTRKDHPFLEGKEGIELSEITAVEPFSKKAPPRLKLSLADGEGLVLAVLNRRRQWMWDKDASARDEAIAAISSATGVG